MELTRAEENKYRLISGTVTMMVMLLLLLFLIYFTIITPNPPFPSGGGGGGIELGLGVMNAGTNDVDYGTMGKITDVVAEVPENKEKLLTADDGETVPMEETKPEVKPEKTVIKPVKPVEVKKEKTLAEKIAERAKKNKGKDGGGTGSSGIEGENGAPNGDPHKHGEGGSGGGSGGGDGTGDGPGKGPGSGPGTGGFNVTGFRAKLEGRVVVTPPKLPSDTKEEGKVVVEITVDKTGRVTEANPNGRGTNTASPLLKAKARRAALDTKFDVSGKFEEQHGTITIVFSFD